MQDLENLETLGPRSIAFSCTTTRCAAASAQPEISKDKLMAELTEVAPKILAFMDVTWDLLDKAHRKGKRILFEGAQGALLDIDHGTYPFVTSSNTVAAQAATGSGMGPRAVGYVLGIAKAYTTRVGSGPFPTELHDAIGERIGERGHEFGTVTGRKRRCGWFDAVLVRQVAKVSGIDGIALTKLDVLDGFETIRICVGYMLDGERINRLPAGFNAQARIEPIWETSKAGRNRRAARAAGRSAGAGGQIRAPHRGADRVPGDAAVDQPGARRHDPDERPVSELVLSDAPCPFPA